MSDTGYSSPTNCTDSTSSSSSINNSCCSYRSSHHHHHSEQQQEYTEERNVGIVTHNNDTIDEDINDENNGLLWEPLLVIPDKQRRRQEQEEEGEEMHERQQQQQSLSLNRPDRNIDRNTSNKNHSSTSTTTIPSSSSSSTNETTTTSATAAAAVTRIMSIMDTNTGGCSCIRTKRRRQQQEQEQHQQAGNTINNNNNNNNIHHHWQQVLVNDETVHTIITEMIQSLVVMLNNNYKNSNNNSNSRNSNNNNNNSSSSSSSSNQKHDTHEGENSIHRNSSNGNFFDLQQQQRYNNNNTKYSNNHDHYMSQNNRNCSNTKYPAIHNNSGSSSNSNRQQPQSQQSSSSSSSFRNTSTTGFNHHHKKDINWILLVVRFFLYLIQYEIYYRYIVPYGILPTIVVGGILGIAIVAQCIEYTFYLLLYYQQVQQFIIITSSILGVVLLLFVSLYYIAYQYYFLNKSTNANRKQQPQQYEQSYVQRLFDLNRKKQGSSTLGTSTPNEEKKKKKHIITFILYSIRIVLTVWYFIVPTIIEIRTFQWLLSIIQQQYNDNGSTIPMQQLIQLLLPLLFYTTFVLYDSTKTNSVNICCCYRKHTTYTTGQHANQRSDSYKNKYYNYCYQQCYKHIGLYILYGWALYCVIMTGTIQHNQNHQHYYLPNLIANFGFTTVVFILYYVTTNNNNHRSSNTNMDISSQTIRMALRQTLYDIVATVQQQQQQQKKNSSNKNNNSSQRTPTNTTSNENSTNTSTPSNMKSTNDNNKSTTNNLHNFNDQQLLLVTILHWMVHSSTWSDTMGMTSSKRSTSNNIAQPAPNKPNDLKRPTTSDPTLIRDNGMQRSLSSPSLSYQQSVFPKPSSKTNVNDSYHRSTSFDQSYANIHTNSRPGTAQYNNIEHSSNNNNESIRNLQMLLANMDLDESVKPAIGIYKMMVENFPPSNFMAILLGLFRRCPTVILLMYHIVLFAIQKVMVQQHHNSLDSLLLFTGLLFPFIHMEILRIRLWIHCCHQVSFVNDNAKERKSLSTCWTLSKVEPMIILLTDESYIATKRVPTLYMVWRNIEASIEILEMSLTVTRCVQTTSAVNDVVSNLLLLSTFGYEILMYGWVHGITILASELIHLYSTGTDPASLWHGTSSPVGASYTSATVSLVRNVDIICRNMHVLSDNEKHNIIKVIAPIVGFFALIIGHGWLWGRQNEDETIHSSRETKSTIEIIELTDDDEIVDSTRKNEEKDSCPRLVASSSCDLQPQKDDVNDVSTDKDGVSLHHCDVSDNEVVKNITTDAKPTSQQSSVGDSQNDGAVSESPSADNVDNDNVPVFTSDSSLSVVEKSPKNFENTFVQGKQEADSNNTIKNPSNTISIDEISEMMDLLSQCDEYGLLQTTERNLILEKLVQVKCDANDSLHEWFCTMKTNLHKLISSHEFIKSSLSSLLNTSEMTEHTPTILPDEVLTQVETMDDINLESDALLTGTQENRNLTTIESLCNTSPTLYEDTPKILSELRLDSTDSTPAETLYSETHVAHDDNNKKPPELGVYDHTTDIQLETVDGHGALSVSSDEEDEPNDIGARLDEKESNHTYSLEIVQENGSTTTHLNEECTMTDSHRDTAKSNYYEDSVMSAQCINKENDDDNIWLKLGGGIAILGGIVGGVVMMNNVAQHKNHSKKR